MDHRSASSRSARRWWFFQVKFFIALSRFMCKKYDYWTSSNVNQTPSNFHPHSQKKQRTKLFSKLNEKVDRRNQNLTFIYGIRMTPTTQPFIIKSSGTITILCQFFLRLFRRDFGLLCYLLSWFFLLLCRFMIVSISFDMIQFFSFNP